jgi:hypothetical protein
MKHMRYAQPETGLGWMRGTRSVLIRLRTEEQGGT